MKNLKKALIASIMVLTLSTTALTTFATDTYKTPVEAVAGITGRTVESIVTEREATGKAYGTIADDAGKLDEYKEAVLAMRKDSLDTQVVNGTITQEIANTMFQSVEDHQLLCDGTGIADICVGMGIGCDRTTIGLANGVGYGTSYGTGYGYGRHSSGHGHRSGGHCR